MKKLRSIDYKGFKLTFWKNNQRGYVYGSYRDAHKKLRGAKGPNKKVVETTLKNNIDKYGVR